MKLDSNSVWYLGGYRSYQPGILITEGTPDYIVEWFREHNADTIELTETELYPDANPDWPVKPNRWPTKEELDTNHHVLITTDNYLTVRDLGLYEELYTTDHYGNYPHHDSVLFNTLWAKSSNLSAKRGGKGSIAQFMKLYGYDAEKSNYRRFKLSKYLEERLGCKYQGITDIRDMTIGDYDIMIISCSVGWHAVSDFTWNKLVYDRTDNWSAWSDDYRDEEQSLIDEADIIICSSQFLYQDTKSRTDNPNVYFIPNGCDVKEYEPVEKYKEITGCYIGKTDNKVDWACIKHVADKYKIKVYGDIEEQFEHPNVEWCGFLPEDELHKEISKCHFGLIPFVGGLWTEGMLPLKLFHYANAHIPTIYKNCPECDAYPAIAKEMNFDNTFELIEPTEQDYEDVLKEANWKEKFDKIWEIIHAKDERHTSSREA